jgi:D-3-phosphoglycerate dehydrogenase / 2-oxoglutarate reductase
MMPSVLITDHVHDRLIIGLVEMGYVVEYHPDIGYQAAKALINTHTGLIINSKVVCDEPILEAATQLKWVARLGSGMEVIDTVACDRRGIHYFNSPEGNRNAVAEHTLGMILNMMRHITTAHTQVIQQQWIRESNRGEELAGRTVGIIGYGHTGSTFARLLGSMDVQVLAHDKYKSGFGQGYVQEASMADICAQADIVSIHLPLTRETTHLIGADFFERLARPIYLINTSRGGVLDTWALIDGLDKGRVKAAALDVLENEKLHTLTGMQLDWWERISTDPRILLTPHIAGWTQESKLGIANTVLDKIKDFCDSLTPIVKPI